MAKKKTGLAARRKKNDSIVTKDNPPPLEDLVEFIIPGFAGYAGTRLASRIVYNAVASKKPGLAKHAKVLSTFGTAAAAWLAVHRIKKIEQYHTPVVVGSSIAALQTFVQSYLPKYGWMVSDPQTPQLSEGSAEKVEQSSAQITSGGGSQPQVSLTLSTPTGQEEELDALESLDTGAFSSTFTEDPFGLDAEDVDLN